MNYAHPFTFSQNGINYRAVVVSQDEEKTKYNLYVDGLWVSTISKENDWVIGGVFSESSQFIKEYMKTIVTP